MNLNDVTDEQATTKKMRRAVKREDLRNEVDRLSKKKNSNPDARSVEPMDGPNDHEGSVEGDMQQISID